MDLALLLFNKWVRSRTPNYLRQIPFKFSFLACEKRFIKVNDRAKSTFRIENELFHLQRVRT